MNNRFMASTAQLFPSSSLCTPDLLQVAKFEETQGSPMAAATGTVRHHSSLIGDQKRTAAALVRLHKMLAKACGRTAVELGPLHDTLALMPVSEVQGCVWTVGVWHNPSTHHTAMRPVCLALHHS